MTTINIQGNYYDCEETRKQIVQAVRDAQAESPTITAIVEIPMNLRKELDDFERRIICKALTMTLGNIAQAARLLGMHRTTFTMRRKSLGLPYDHNNRERMAIARAKQNPADPKDQPGSWKEEERDPKV